MFKRLVADPASAACQNSTSDRGGGSVSLSPLPVVWLIVSNRQRQREIYL